MWKLTVIQKVQHETYTSEQEVVFVDENQNNLLDLIRYLGECKTPYPTKYSIEPVKED